MKSSSALGTLLALSYGFTAWAGACCVGSTAANPARVGECEKSVIALAVGAENTDGWWDRDGELHDSSVRERSGITTLGAGLRVSRQWQLGLSAPARLNHHKSETISGWGGGLGDVRATALWDPTEEKMVAEGWGPPVPILTFGLRLPTGRDWTESSGILHEDVTGLEQPGLVTGAAIERTLGKWPWSVGTTAEIGVGSTVQPVVATSGSFGRYLGSRWTVAGTLSHQIGWASLGVHASAQTNTGISVIHGSPGRWRGWISAMTGIPHRVAGVSATRKTSLTTGFAVVL